MWNESGGKSFKLEKEKNAFKRYGKEWNESYVGFFQIKKNQNGDHNESGPSLKRNEIKRNETLSTIFSAEL